MRSSIVLASAFAVGALAVPHVQLEKRVLVTEVDWELTTVTVYVTVGPEPESTSTAISTTEPVPEAEPTKAFTPEVLPTLNTPVQTPSITAAPKPTSTSDDEAPPSEEESENPKILSLYQRPVRPVFGQSSSTNRGIYPPSRPVFYTPPRPVYTPPRAAYTPPVYTPPRPVYTPPRPAYTPPAPVYTPPRPVYSPPQPVYTPPRPVYTPPQPVYTPPQPVYTPPRPVYTPPTVSPVQPPVNTPPTSPSAPSGGHISGPSQAFLSSGPDYQAAILYHHNAARANHNAAPLTWDDNLAATALQAGQRCTFEHYIPTGVRQGQNLFTVSGNAFNVTAGITESWYKGELDPMLPYFGRADIPDEVFHNVGHLTQMVWKGTTSVGCVSVDCTGRMLVGGKPSTMNKYTVCNYGPPGNVKGNYAQNVAYPNSLTALGKWSD